VSIRTGLDRHTDMRTVERRWARAGDRRSRLQTGHAGTQPPSSEGVAPPQVIQGESRLTCLWDDIHHLSVRYPRDHKEETRARIVQAASRRFRKGGAGVAIGELMKTLKLTHGGFYRHFKSKDALFAEAIERAFEEGAARMTQAAAAAKGHELEAIICTYLSEGHCNDPAGGCALAGLASEVARQPRAVRAALDRAILLHSETMARYMPGSTEDERRGNALALFSGMSGSLGLARALVDDDLRRTVLASARKMYLEAYT
jgi:TetR/AcrR family transcriptional repressor of nem operon